MESLKGDPSISVIITTYNDHSFLKSAVESVENQSLKPSEIIVVDDGSQGDDAQHILDKFPNELEILFYKKKNGGSSDARNYGLSKARGAYVAFLDVDDIWLPQNLEKKYIALSSKPNFFFGCYGGFVAKAKGKRSSFRAFDGCLDPDLIGKKNGFPGGAPLYLFRKSALDCVGGFDVDLKQNEDFDLILRLIHFGYRALGNNEFGYVRNFRSGSLTRNDHYRRSYDNVDAFLKKAEINGYFSKNELLERRKLNALRFFKFLFLARKNYKLQGELLDFILSNGSPKRIKYLPLILYRNVLRWLRE